MTPFTIGLLVSAICLTALVVMFFIACGGLRKAENEDEKRRSSPEWQQEIAAIKADAVSGDGAVPPGWWGESCDWKARADGFEARIDAHNERYDCTLKGHPSDRELSAALELDRIANTLIANPADWMHQSRRIHACRRFLLCGTDRIVQPERFGAGDARA